MSPVSLLLYSTVPCQERSGQRNLTFLFEWRIWEYASTLPPAYKNTEVTEVEVLRLPFLQAQPPKLLNYSPLFFSWILNDATVSWHFITV